MKHTGFVLGLLLVGAAACGDNGHVVADHGLGSAGSSASGGSAAGAPGQDHGGSAQTGGASGEKDETGGADDAGAPPTGGSDDGGSTSGGRGSGGATAIGGRHEGGSAGDEGEGGSAAGGRGSGGGSATGGQGDGGESTTGGNGSGGATATGGSGDAGSATGGQGDGGTTATGGQGTGGGMVIPNCGYRDIPGKGTITSIETATEADGYLCDNGSVSVRYEFLPDDTSLSPDEYDVATVNMDPVKYHQLFIDSRLVPPACVDLLGLEVGNQYTVIRRIAISGSCTPAMDSFSDLDLGSCASLCL
jgi:hypothetical protein